MHGFAWIMHACQATCSDSGGRRAAGVTLHPNGKLKTPSDPSGKRSGRPVHRAQTPRTVHNIEIYCVYISHGQATTINSIVGHDLRAVIMCAPGDPAIGHLSAIFGSTRRRSHAGRGPPGAQMCVCKLFLGMTGANTCPPRA